MTASGAHIDPKVVEVPVALTDIEAVPDHKLVGETEAYVAKIGFHLLHALFQKESTDLEAGWVASGKVLAQVVEREATVDNVFDDDDVSTSEVDIKVLHDANDAAGLRCGSVGRHRHEVEFYGKRNGAGDVGHEHDCALEDRNEQWRSAGIVGSDFFAEFSDALLNRFVGDEDLTKMGIDIGMRMFVTGRALGHAANVVQSLGLRCRNDAKFSCSAFDATVSTDVGRDRLITNDCHYAINSCRVGRMSFIRAVS